MRVLQVVPYRMDRVGGVQNHVRALSVWLNRQGHQCTIIAPGQKRHYGLSRDLRIGHPKLVQMHGTQFELSAALPWEMRRFARFARDFAPDIVHYHTPWVPLLPTQIARRLSCASVATFHATLPNDGQDILSRWLLKQAQAWSDTLDATAVPSAVPQAQWAAAGITPAPAILAPAIDLDPWRAAGQARAAVRDQVQTIVCIGRSEGRKGIEVIGSAWAQIAAALPHATLRLIGGAADAGGDSAQVVRVPHAPDAVLRAEVAAADLLIAPAGYGESFGLVLAEAMAAGTPIVAAKNPAYQATLGPDACFFKAGQADDLATQVIALARDPNRRRALQSVGHAQAEIADIRCVGPAYLRFYTDATGRSKRDGSGQV